MSSVTVTSISPALGAQNGILYNVLIGGTGFLSGPTVDLGAGITASSISVLSSTQIQLTLTIASGAAATTRSVTVTNSDTTSGSLSSAFIVRQPSFAVYQPFDGVGVGYQRNGMLYDVRGNSFPYLYLGSAFGGSIWRLDRRTGDITEYSGQFNVNADESVNQQLNGDIWWLGNDPLNLTAARQSQTRFDADGLSRIGSVTYDGVSIVYMTAGGSRVDRHSDHELVYHLDNLDPHDSHGNLWVWNQTTRVLTYFLSRSSWYDQPTGGVINRVWDMDPDGDGNIWLVSLDDSSIYTLLWKVTPSGTQTMVANLTSDIPSPGIPFIRWIQSDNSLVIASGNKAIKWSIDGGAVSDSMTLPLSIAEGNYQCWHHSLDNKTSVYLTEGWPSGPIFYEIDLLTLTHKRTINFDGVSGVSGSFFNGFSQSYDGARNFRAFSALYDETLGGVWCEDFWQGSVGAFVFGDSFDIIGDVDIDLPVDTLSFTDELSVLTSTRFPWLDKQNSKKIYIVELTLRYPVGATVQTEILYLSNHPYNSRPDEDPPNTEFIAVLQDENIPSFSLDLSDVFFGLATPAFGALKIHNADGQFDNKLPPNRQWEGGAFLIKLISDRSDLTISDAITVSRGVMGKPSWDDNTITVELFSRTRELEKAQLLSDTFDGPNGEKILYPELYGYGQNLAPILKDSTNLIYLVARSINAVTAVYDNGVLLSPGQYTVNVANGTFTLLVNPSGQITCDAQGRSVNGVFTAKRGNFVYDMVIRRGAVDAGDFDVPSLTDFNTLVPGDSQFYVTSQVSVLDAAQSLLRPVIGSLTFDRPGTVSLHVLSIPDNTETVVLRLTADEIIPGDASTDDAIGTNSAVSVSASDLLYYKVTLQYDQNLTIQTEDSIGAADPVDPDTDSGRARRAWLKDEWRTSVVEQTGPTVGKNLYPTASELEALPSYFVHKVDADQWAFNWLSLFSETRKVTIIKAKMLPLRTTLYNVISLTYRWFNNKPMRAISYQEDYGQNSIQVGMIS